VITRHDPQKAYDLIYDFTRYLSYHIDSLQGDELTTFTEELGHIREYTNIEQEHMGRRLRVEFHIGPTDFEIPPLSVEPFVENAVKHGVWPKRDGGAVSIASAETPDAWVITIRDDGVGFDPANPPPPVLRSHGIGMKYAIERLKAMVDGAVRVDSEADKGTTVTIEIPKKTKERDE
jgi:sensor histidine kinase YesM